MPAPLKSADLPRRPRRALSIVLHAVAFLLVAFYLVQHARMATNHTDGGLILTYIDDIANGLYPHWDFIDAYGTLNWPMPVLFYKLAGHQEWGVRVWIFLLKLIIVGLSYMFVRRLAGTLYGVLAAIWMTLLYGMAWQSLQTAYGFNNVIPYVLGSWYLLLVRPFQRFGANFVLAGILTGAAIWVKVNSGMLVLLGGLFYCFYWLPSSPSAQPSAWDTRWQRLFHLARTLGLLAYALFFYAYLREHFEAWYFVYLLGPLLLGLFWTGRRLELLSSAPAAAESAVAVSRHLQAFSLYFAATIACALGILLAVTGVTGALDYLRDQAGIFVPLHYQMPFPLLGVPDEFVGFNENFWPQLPWLLPLLFFVWLELQRAGRGTAVFGAKWQETESLAVGLYIMAVLYQFNLYSRADETHIYQAMVMVPPAALVLLRQIEAMCVKAWDRTNLALRSALCVTLLAWGSTIAVMPSFEVFDFSTGERSHPTLSYLRMRELYNPYVRDFTPDITDNHWDRIVDEAGVYIDGITRDGEKILVLDANRLIHILSNTRPVGDRHHFYFYLISTRLFDRAGFDQSVPRSVIQNILDDPPRVVIGDNERIPPVAEAFPEIRHMVTKRYRVTKQYRHILIYERDDTLLAGM